MMISVEIILLSLIFLVMMAIFVLTGAAVYFLYKIHEVQSKPIEPLSPLALFTGGLPIGNQAAPTQKEKEISPEGKAEKAITAGGGNYL
jgi:hypothetical protein